MNTRAIHDFYDSLTPMPTPAMAFGREFRRDGGYTAAATQLKTKTREASLV